MGTKIKGKRTPKKDKVPVTPLRLIRSIGVDYMGVFYDILSTDWIGASKCSYDPKAKDRIELLYSTTFYFARFAEAFSCNSSVVMLGRNVKVTGRWVSNNLQLGVTYYGEENALGTVNLMFPQGLWEPMFAPKYIQVKSSTFVQYLCGLVYKNMRQSPERRKDMYDSYMASNSGDIREDFARLLSGNVSMDEVEPRVLEEIGSDLTPMLLSLYRTLAYFNFAQQHHKAIVTEDGVVALPKAVLYFIEEQCAAHPSPVSKMSAKDTSSDLHIVGNASEYLIPAALIAQDDMLYRWLWSTKERSLDVEEDTQVAVDSFFFIDSTGQPITTPVLHTISEGSWRVHATGKHDATSGMLMYVLVDVTKRSLAVGFYTMPDLAKKIRSLTGDMGLDCSLYEKMSSPSFQLMGTHLQKCLDQMDNSDTDDEFDLVSEVPFYPCTTQILPELSESAEICSLDRLNFFVDGFIRMLNRRGFSHTGAGVYNTGVPLKNGATLHLSISGIGGPRSKTQVTFVQSNPYDISPTLFAKSQNYMWLRSDEQINFDRQTLVHVMEERSYRLPKELHGSSLDAIMLMVKHSVNIAMLQLQVNPSYAYPVYSERADRVFHMIPLLMIGTTDAVGALLVKYGRVATLFSLDIARDDAALFRLPLPLWLREEHDS